MLLHVSLSNPQNLLEYPTDIKLKKCFAIKEENIIKSEQIPISLIVKFPKYGFIKLGNISLPSFGFSNDNADGMSAKPILSVKAVSRRRESNFITFERYELNKKVIAFIDGFLKRIIYQGF